MIKISCKAAIGGIMLLFKRVACNDCHVWTVGFLEGDFVEAGAGGLRLDQTVK